MAEPAERAPLVDAVSTLSVLLARRPLLSAGSLLAASLLLAVAASVVYSVGQGWRDPRAQADGALPIAALLSIAATAAWMALLLALLAAVRAFVRAARSRQAGRRLRELDVCAATGAIRLDEHGRAAETVLSRAQGLLPGQPGLGLGIAALPLGLLSALGAASRYGLAAACEAKAATACGVPIFYGVLSTISAGLLLGLSVLAAWGWWADRGQRREALRWEAALADRVASGAPAPPMSIPEAARGPRVEVLRTYATRGAANAHEASRRQP